MDGKAVCWLPAPRRAATDTKTALFVPPAGLRGSQGHKNGRFCVASCPWRLKSSVTAHYKILIVHSAQSELYKELIINPKATRRYSFTQRMGRA